MKALIINLAGETGRMAFQRKQMASLRLDYERIDAITPETLCPAADDLFWALWERPLRPGEKAFFASHQKAWEAVVRAAAPCLILEDNALLSTETPAFLSQVETFQGPEHLSLEVRVRKKLVSRKHLIAGGATSRPAPVRRLYQDRPGSAAYILWPSGACKLLKRSRRHPGLSDAAITAA